MINIFKQIRKKYDWITHEDILAYTNQDSEISDTLRAQTFLDFEQYTIYKLTHAYKRGFFCTLLMFVFKFHALL